MFFRWKTPNPISLPFNRPLQSVHFGFPPSSNILPYVGDTTPLEPVEYGRPTFSSPLRHVTSHRAPICSTRLHQNVTIPHCPVPCLIATGYLIRTPAVLLPMPARALGWRFSSVTTDHQRLPDRGNLRECCRSTNPRQ